MPHKYNTIKSLELQEILRGKHIIIDNILNIFFKLERKEQICPICGTHTIKIHDYRNQTIKDLDAFGCQVVLQYKKRRYACTNCNKNFFEKINNIPRYSRNTSRVFFKILSSCQTQQTCKAIAKANHVSDTSVRRYLKMFKKEQPKTLPKVLGIDEFKGNASKEKYQVILTDIENKKIIDILPSRKKEDLIEYFKEYSDEERSKVDFFVMDMWGTYRDIGVLFPKAKIVVDKYHYVRQVYWALDSVRKNMQNDTTDKMRKSIKRIRKLLYKDFSELKPKSQDKLLKLLNQSEKLEQAWQLKEIFLDVKKQTVRSQAERELKAWIEVAEESRISEFKDVIRAYRNWNEGILNNLEYGYTNAFTEGMNNKIKVLKRISYGFRSFDNFRARILNLA